MTKMLTSNKDTMKFNDVYESERGSMEIDATDETLSLKYYMACVLLAEIDEISLEEVDEGIISIVSTSDINWNGRTKSNYLN